MRGLVVYVGVLGIFLVAGGSPWARAWGMRQRWLRPLVAALAVGCAVALGISGLQQPGMGWLPALLAVGCGWVLGPLAGRVLSVQKAANIPVHWAAQRLAGLGGLSFGDACRVLVVLVAWNPAGWLAGWNSGLADDIRCAAWKSVLDGVTLMTLATWRPGCAVVAAWAGAGVQGLAAGAGLLARPWMEKHGMVGPALVASGLVWLTLPLLVLGIRRVPLFALVLAVPASALFAAWFR